MSFRRKEESRKGSFFAIILVVWLITILAAVQIGIKSGRQMEHKEIMDAAFGINQGDKY